MPSCQVIYYIFFINFTELFFFFFFFFQAEDGIRDWSVTGVQTCALPICPIRGRQAGYTQRQYIHEDPSDSLEYNSSDFAIAQFARALGDIAKYNTYMSDRKSVV